MVNMLGERAVRTVWGGGGGASSWGVHAQVWKGPPSRAGTRWELGRAGDRGRLGATAVTWRRSQARTVHGFPARTRAVSACMHAVIISPSHLHLVCLAPRLPSFFFEQKSEFGRLLSDTSCVRSHGCVNTSESGATRCDSSTCADDMLFAERLLDKLEEDVCLDRDRIHAVRLQCQFPPLRCCNDVVAAALRPGACRVCPFLKPCPTSCTNSRINVFCLHRQASLTAL
jgi:hypothetical protein